MANHESIYELFQANKDARVRIFMTTGKEVSGTVAGASPDLVAVEAKNQETWCVVYEHIAAIVFDEKPASASRMGYR
jgi:sRNA-binding regulator protein Hfq